MVYRGFIKNGGVVFEDNVTLPEGAKVQVRLVDETGEEPLLDEQGRTLGQKMLKYAGKAVGLPPDAARNHDHYLNEFSKQ